jgi:hypothetical protein
MATGFTAFLVVWAGAVWGTIAFHAPLIFPVVFGGVGLLLVYVTLDQWLRVTRVIAGDGRVAVASGWLGPRRERTILAGEIADVVVKIGAQSGSTPLYDVILATTSGEGVAAGGGIRDKREAEWLAGVIRRAVKPA